MTDVKRKKPRVNQWVYHYDEKDSIAAITLYGSEKLIGKVVRSASKYGSIKDISHYYVTPIFAFGGINDKKGRWFSYHKVRIVCRPNGAKDCDNCTFRFACWTTK